MRNDGLFLLCLSFLLVLIESVSFASVFFLGGGHQCRSLPPLFTQHLTVKRPAFHTVREWCLFHFVQFLGVIDDLRLLSPCHSRAASEPFSFLRFFLFLLFARLLAARSIHSLILSLVLSPFFSLIMNDVNTRTIIDNNLRTWCYKPLIKDASNDRVVSVIDELSPPLPPHIPTCPICFLALSIPFQLQCTHALCGFCLQLIQAGSQLTQVSCPKCRELSTPVYSYGIAEFCEALPGYEEARESATHLHIDHAIDRRAQELREQDPTFRFSVTRPIRRARLLLLLWELDLRFPVSPASLLSLGLVDMLGGDDAANQFTSNGIIRLRCASWKRCFVSSDVCLPAVAASSSSSLSSSSSSAFSFLSP